MHHELNRQSIDTLVRDFYADVRRDGVLQPVFDGAIGAVEGMHQRAAQATSSSLDGGWSPTVHRRSRA